MNSLIGVCCYSGRRRLFPTEYCQTKMKIHWFTVFLSSYSGRRRLFPTEYCRDMSKHVDFRSLFLKIRETKSHKNRFCSSCEVEVIWPFSILSCCYKLGSCWDNLLFISKLGPGPSTLGPDPSQTLNYGLQMRSVQFWASGVRQVSSSSSK